jgi:hypothetical protein
MSDHPDHVRDALASMYGAVAAVVRDDRAGLDLLLRDLYCSFDDFTELLATVSFATLDRLQAALAEGHAPSPRETRALAEHLLTEAHRLALADAVPVQAAARRLDAVRRHDHDEVSAEVQHARSVASDVELLNGATALLAATVSVWADRSGRNANRAVSDLCLAASAEPVA